MSNDWLKSDVVGISDVCFEHAFGNLLSFWSKKITNIHGFTTQTLKFYAYEMYQGK